jgi:hypothetical protein
MSDVNASTQAELAHQLQSVKVKVAETRDRLQDVESA